MKEDIKQLEKALELTKECKYTEFMKIAVDFDFTDDWQKEFARSRKEDPLEVKQYYTLMDIGINSFKAHHPSVNWRKFIEFLFDHDAQDYTDMILFNSFKDYPNA